MGWKLDYFQKVSVFENLSKAQIWPKRKYHLFSHLIWRKFQVFDKGLGNFENLYLRNAITINYGGGLPTLDVFKKWGAEKNVSQNDKKLFQIAWNGEIIGERSEIIGERSETIGARILGPVAKRDYRWAKRDYRWA